jgi:hypothetical protein
MMTRTLIAIVLASVTMLAQQKAPQPFRSRTDAVPLNVSVFQAIGS